MSITDKNIGINQRVPFPVLDQGLSRFLLTGTIEREALTRHMLEFTNGPNRAAKAASIAGTILTRPEPILKVLANNLSAETYNRLPESERKALVLALLAYSYPIAYSFLVTLAVGFKAQSMINRTFINQKMSAIYGGNRVCALAVDALIPMLIELGAIQRVKHGIYGQSPQKLIQTSIIVEAYIYTDIFLSGSRTILVSDTVSRPWYQFFVVNYSNLTHNKLLKFTDAPIGGGYLGIK